MGVIIFNGKSSNDYHIQVEHPPGYDFPERDYETVHVPGRNGDLIIDNGSYKNVNRTYEISVGDMDRLFPTMARDISNWLHSGEPYSRLEDSYEPDCYRLASYVEEGKIENLLFHGARIKITFNCKPQRFLKIGDRKKKLTHDLSTIKNPTPYDAYPIILVYGNGTGIGYLTIESKEYNYYTAVNIMRGSRNPIIINSEVQDVYDNDENTNRNPDVIITKGFPVFKPGNSTIAYSGDITAVEVIPKWWIL